MISIALRDKVRALSGRLERASDLGKSSAFADLIRHCSSSLSLIPSCEPVDWCRCTDTPTPTRSWTACGPHDPARFLLAFLVRNRSIYSCRLSLSLPLSGFLSLPLSFCQVPRSHSIYTASCFTPLLDNLSPLYLSTHVPFRWFPSLRPFSLQTMSGIAISLRCHDEVCPGVCVCKNCTLEAVPVSIGALFANVELVFGTERHLRALPNRPGIT